MNVAYLKNFFVGQFQKGHQVYNIGFFEELFLEARSDIFRTFSEVLSGL